ncbi:MAG: four helix bundle protein [Candidatus Promineifilaceae bacterium]|nr:four helix bundle protein [Chloroflexota bacterium]MBK7180565.1 four helix bundle protein [Chloroflexota bacterium]MBK7917578.1 four helix bundle protein [Chloroflexota bacterium]MBK8934563.1 four helix bundle protein [Chloroflexota bacterium]MBP7591352.1 four helix bundle protein [Chloroflexota bacterium]
MDKKTMQERTKNFALRVIRLINTLPDTPTTRVIGNQLLRSATSVGANYRAACRAKSDADFLYKLSIVEEEADESLYWLELILEAEIVREPLLQPLLQEANELVAITVATIKTLKQNKK